RLAPATRASRRCSKGSTCDHRTRNPARPLRDPVTPRRGRHGRGLPGAGHAAYSPSADPLRSAALAAEARKLSSEVEFMKSSRPSHIIGCLLLVVWPDATPARSLVESPCSMLHYEAVPGFFQLPPGENFVEPCGVAVNSKGHIYVFHRGKHPLMEFDPSGKLLGSIADDLFVTAHMV